MKIIFSSGLAGAFFLLGGVFGLASCQSNTTNRAISAPPSAASPEPSVLATTRHYARLLSQAKPPRRDSLLHYGPGPAEASVLPGHYLLRLRTYVVDVQPEGVLPTVSIVPPEIALPAAATPPTKPGSGPALPGMVRVEPNARSSNPVLAIQLPGLTGIFGPWQGDFYIAEEEPLAPEMHPTELHYRNPTTRQGCRITVYLKNAPAAATNAVHKITLWRDDQP